jgi:Alpha/beta hydrolase of unknown function (DUF1057).
MNDYKFRVIFLDEAKEFLDGLNEKQEIRLFTTFGSQEVLITMSCSKNFRTRFGNLEHLTISHITDFLHFGINRRKMKQL